MHWPEEPSSSWLGCATLGIGWASSWVTVNGDVLLAHLEHDVRRFLGVCAQPVDAAQVIILSIKVEERGKTECS